MTSEEDIGFAIHYDKTMKANNLIEMETVFPYIRLECSQVPCNGSIVCENAGRCTSMSFDISKGLIKFYRFIFKNVALWEYR